MSTRVVLTYRDLEAMPEDGRRYELEVLSPSTAQRDRGAKLQLFARHRIPFYWVVDLEARRLEAYALSGDALTRVGHLGGEQRGPLPPFPDLMLPVGRLWS